MRAWSDIPAFTKVVASMHLLENGVNLIYIRDILGHASIVTTEVYAKANTEMKRQAVEAAAGKRPVVSPLPCC